MLYRCRRNVWILLVGVALALTGSPWANASSAYFDVAAGEAVNSLKTAARQGGVEILISIEATYNVRTNAIVGRYEVQRALDLILAGTPLVAVPVRSGGAYGIIKRSSEQGDNAHSEAPTELENDSGKSPKEADSTNSKGNQGGLLKAVLATVIPRAAQARDGGVDDAQIFNLSPFEFRNSDNDIGYYSENTLAGSRLNSSISDLASSITVVTSQQLGDTASTDINDIFLYEANTEGTGNYTAYEIDKDGAVRDHAAGHSNGGVASGPSTANRVRGIAPADTARDYFPSIARIPFDSYNTRSIEINRGPNSILFGLGNAAGIVNQSQTKAVVGAEFGNLQFRLGSWDAFRASGSYNTTLVENILAVNVAMLREEKGFRRKPSYDKTDRQYLTITYKPSRNTAFRGTYENYENKNRRPNSVTPRDMITPWKEAGSPTWNPTTRSYTLGGQTLGPVDSNRDLPTGLAAPSARPVFHYDQGTLLGANQRSLGNNAGEVAGGTVYRMLRSNGETPGPLYIFPGVTNQELYDWERLNIISSNVGSADATIATFEWDHQILDDLYLNVGYMKESYEATNSYFIGQQTGATIEIDPNTHLLDGSVNPYFGRPFIEIREPDDLFQREKNSSLRATLAYELDFREYDGWARKLGSHHAMGLMSKQEYATAYYRWRQVALSNNPWVDLSDRVGGVEGAIFKRMYLGGSDGKVRKDPGHIFNSSETVSMPVAYPLGPIDSNEPLDSFAWGSETVELGRALHSVSDGAQRETDSEAFVLQSRFWSDRFVTTLGWRRDKNKARTSNLPAIDPVSGTANPEDVATRFGDWQTVSGNTSTAGIVFKPYPWLNFHYNESDNFTPAGVLYNIGTGEPLPLPTGEGKDWGLGGNLLGGKFYAKLNFFEAGQISSRVGGTSTPIWRMGYFDEDFFGDWARYVARSEGLAGAAAEARASEITRFPENFTAYNDSVLGTSTLKAKGVEFQIIYNPTKNWTLKFNAARQKTVFSEIAPEYTAWKEERVPFWKAARSDALPVGFQSFWDYNNDNAPFDIGTKRNALHGALNTPEKWFNTNVDANMALQRTLAGKKTPGQREWRCNAISNYRFTDGRLNGFSVGGSIRWEDAAIIGYLAGPADEDGVVRQLDASKPVYGSDGFHVDFWGSYTLPLKSDKVGIKFQLNIRDAFEIGRLEAISINPDGRESAFRIVDPRQVFLTTILSF